MVSFFVRRFTHFQQFTAVTLFNQVCRRWPGPCRWSTGTNHRSTPWCMALTAVGANLVCHVTVAVMRSAPTITQVTPLVFMMWAAAESTFKITGGSLRWPAPRRSGASPTTAGFHRHTPARSCPRSMRRESPQCRAKAAGCQRSVLQWSQPLVWALPDGDGSHRRAIVRLASRSLMDRDGFVFQRLQLSVLSLQRSRRSRIRPKQVHRGRSRVIRQQGEILLQLPPPNHRLPPCDHAPPALRHRPPQYQSPGRLAPPCE